MSIINIGRALAGTASLSIDGVPYSVVSGAKYFVSPIERTTVKGQTAVEGFKEMPQPCWIEAVIRDNGNMTVALFNSLTASSLVLQLANGKTVAGDNMWCVTSEEVDTEEATFRVRFEGTLVQEIPL